MKRILAGIIFILVAVPAFAQSVDHRELVAAVKEAVLREGIDLAHGPGECGRFEVTRRVAYELRAEGAGLLSKPAGNNCDGYAVDIVAYRDGAIVDVLCGSATDANVPCWTILAPVDPARWRAPLAVEAPPAPVPPTPEPPATVDDHDAKLDQILYQVEQLRQQETADTERILARINEVVKNAEKAAPGFFAALVKVLTLGVAGR